METKLKMFYRKKMYGGRSLIARMIDFVVLRTLMFIILAALFFYAFRSLLPALLISGFVTAAFSVILIIAKRRKAEKFMQKDMQRVKRKCLLQMLTLMSSADFIDYMSRLFDDRLIDVHTTARGFTAKLDDRQLHVFHNHPTSVCGAAEVLQVYRALRDTDKVIIVSLSPYSKDAKTFCANLDTPIKLVCGDDVLSIADNKDMLPDEDRANESVQEEMKEAVVTLKKMKKNAFGRAKIKAYIFCGIVIMCWPLISGFKFYYPIIAFGCFVMAVISYKKSRQARKQSDIGIF